MLSLAFAGSAGKSREELLTAFHLDEGDNVLADIGKAIKNIFEQDAKKTMVQANGAFIDGRLDVLGEYKATLMTHFDSDIQEVRRVINCFCQLYCEYVVKLLSYGNFLKLGSRDQVSFGVLQ